MCAVCSNNHALTLSNYMGKPFISICVLILTLTNDLTVPMNVNQFSSTPENTLRKVAFQQPQFLCVSHADSYI